MDNDGIWISIDGVDGTGKTTLVERLFSMIPNSVISPKFSDSGVGPFMKNAVQRSPFEVVSSPIEQCFLCIADFFGIYDNFISSSLQQGFHVISDRGYLTKFAYQQYALEKTFGRVFAKNLLNEVFKCIPTPEITILLSCEEDIIIDRLERRRRYWNIADNIHIKKLSNLIADSASILKSKRLLVEQSKETKPDEVYNQVIKYLSDIGVMTAG